MKKALLVYNPLSGDQSIKHRMDFMIRIFQENKVVLTPYRIFQEQDDSLLAQLLLSGDYEFVIACGGDGTVNAVVSIILSYQLKIPLGLVPAGTCNDFARCLNISDNLEENLQTIIRGKTMRVDVGMLGQNLYFLSTCAGGLFVNVSFTTDNELKKNLGPFAYYLKGLSDVTNLKSFPLKITTSEEVIEEDALLFLILNGKHAAGFSNIIDDAVLTDGLLDIIIIKNCSHFDLAGLFFKFLSTGSIDDKNIIKLKTSKCYMESETPIILSIDGEKGLSLPQKISVLNRSLEVFVN